VRAFRLSLVRLRRQQGLTLMELLVSLIITSIVSAMLVTVFLALMKSNAYSINSAQARDQARTALSRLEREIRDAETPTNAYYAASGFNQTTTACLARSSSTWLALFTTFNETGAMPYVTPRLVVYRLYSDGQLWRYVDADGNGRNGSLGSWNNCLTGSINEATETTTWEGAQMVVADVVNGSEPSASAPTDLFDYSYYDSSGTLQQQNIVSGGLRQSILAVQIHLLVDLNPGHAPAYADLMTTAQLRNARQI
jgi:prepilin-type N-terminal cleavage/methylation domain-containing protein